MRIQIKLEGDEIFMAGAARLPMNMLDTDKPSDSHRCRCWATKRSCEPYAWLLEPKPGLQPSTQPSLVTARTL